MKKRQDNYPIIAVIVLVLAGMACLQSSAPAQPKASIPPITLVTDLTQIDLCQAIPKEDMEAVMGRKLVSDPQRFDYYGTPGSSGCTYSAGKDSSGTAYFSYVVLTTPDVYDNQPLYKNVAVSGIGDQAYFNNGADARQLWVKIGNKVAFVVAIGDLSNEEGAKAIARLMISAIK